MERNPLAILVFRLKTFSRESCISTLVRGHIADYYPDNPESLVEIEFDLKNKTGQAKFHRDIRKASERLKQYVKYLFIKSIQTYLV